MSKRFLGIAGVLSLLVVLALGATAAAQQPMISNGRVSPQPAGSPLAQSFRTLIGAQAEPAWIGYSVPIIPGDRTMCSWDTQHTVVTTAGPRSPVKLEGPRYLMVLFRVAERKVERIRVFTEDCPLDAGGLQVHWLENVRPAESVALLDSMTSGQDSRKVSEGAISALSLHADPAADSVLIRAARTHTTAAVRGNALFWLSQRAGQKAIGTITESLDQDPDTEVKKRAVFALSQLPRNEGVPLLINVARTHKNPAVKKQAMFWLGQSKDPRAIDFFAEILR
jgi:HEAT repeat protein